MHSVGALSTNDVSSTARFTTITEMGDDASDHNKKGNNNMSSPRLNPTLTLTTDGIIKECIKQGFYRTPVCNDKLYLHNKGYDTIAPTAFELYTDVKVLWLEGNALAALPCGGELIRVKPPRIRNALLASSSSSSASGDGEEGAAGEGEDGGVDDAIVNNTTNCNKDDDDNGGSPDAAAATELTRHADPLTGIVNNSNGNTVDIGTDTVAADKTTTTTHRHHHQQQYPDSATVPVEDRDVFSSLYPTVRQLYLHNNIFRVMPDLSRFERLDSINIANNFFTRVEPHCPMWQQGLRSHAEAVEEAERAALGKEKKNVLGDFLNNSVNNGVNDEDQDEDEDEVRVVAVAPALATAAAAAAAADAAALDENALVLLTPAEAAAQRAAQLAQYRALVDAHAAFCSHAAMPEVQLFDRVTGQPCKSSRRKQRALESEFCCPCSTLRTLNFAANHIATLDDFIGLLPYKAVSVLDLSQNRISDGEVLLMVLEKLSKLRSLKLSGNPMVRTLGKYRKTVLARCPGLLHLDDRPVFPEERRLVTAWAAGGEAAEATERGLIKAEGDAAVRKRVSDFRALLDSYRGGVGGGGATTTTTAATTMIEGASNSHNISNENNTAAGSAAHQQLHPSHVPYVNAVTGGSGAAGVIITDADMKKSEKAAARARENAILGPHHRRRSNGAPDSDPDDSATSSEDEEEEEEVVVVDNNTPVVASAAAATTADSRVLSSNGDIAAAATAASSRRKLVVEEVDADLDDEGNEDDVYIPS